MYLLEIWESFTSANEAFLMSFRKRLKLETSLKPSIEKPPKLLRTGKGERDLLEKSEWWMAAGMQVKMEEACTNGEMSIKI